jgi:hypothetical protein
MASRLLNDLDPQFRPLVVEFLARATEAKIPLLIVETRRTLAEHEANVRAGKSWTSHSPHIRGLAIDVCPYLHYGPGRSDKVLLWDVKDAAISDPIWEKLGEIGEACGMRWGGRWGVRDCPHFEMKSMGMDVEHAANVQTGGRI